MMAGRRVVKKYESVGHDKRSGVNILAFNIIIIMEKLLENWRLGKSFREISTRRRRVPPIEGVAEGGSFPVICSWEKFPHLSQERPKNRVDISPRTLPREEIVVGFSLVLCK